MTTWKGKSKTKLCILVDYSFKPVFSNTLAIGQKYYSFYPPPFFDQNRVINFELFLGKQFFKLIMQVYI